MAKMGLALEANCWVWWEIKGLAKCMKVASEINIYLRSTINSTKNTIDTAVMVQ